MSRSADKRRASSPSSESSAAKRARAVAAAAAATQEDESVVERVYYVGACQPLAPFEDANDGTLCLPDSPLLLDMTIVWQDASRKRGTIKGTISWMYGMFWANDASLDAEDQMFWRVAQQQETIVGDVVVQRERSRPNDSASATDTSEHETYAFAFHTQRLGVVDTTETTIEHDETPSALVDKTVVDYVLEQFERERVYHFTQTSDMSWQLNGTVGAMGVGDEATAEDESPSMPQTQVCLHRLPTELQRQDADALADPLALIRAFAAEKTEAAEQELAQLHLSPALVDRLLKIIARIVTDPADLGARNISYDAIRAKFPELVPALHILGFARQLDASTGKLRLIWAPEQDLMQLCDLHRVLVALLE
jgi:hypothetical protein